MTYRWKEHVGPNEDYGLGYRAPDEAEPWIKDDQVKKYAALVTPKNGSKSKRKLKPKFRKPFRLRKAALSRIISNSTRMSLRNRLMDNERTLTYAKALLEATEQLMASDPHVVVFGLDVDDPKGIQGTTLGLPQKFGPARVFGTPLSEDAMTGVGIGMALAGCGPSIYTSAWIL